MKRRNFLRIAFASGAIAATPIALAVALEKRVPVIYGDGEHDDWAGLQAALDGKEFVCSGDLVQRTPTGVTIRNGTFKVGRTLTLKSHDQIEIAHSLFKMPGVDPCFRLEGSSAHFINTAIDATAEAV